MFPALAELELQELADDIAANGLRNPIVMYQGKILDGLNRWEAWKLAKVEPRFVEFDGDDPIGWVVSQNLVRRQLSSSTVQLHSTATTNPKPVSIHSKECFRYAFPAASVGLHVSDKKLRCSTVARCRKAAAMSHRTSQSHNGSVGRRAIGAATTPWLHLCRAPHNDLWHSAAAIL